MVPKTSLASSSALRALDWGALLARPLDWDCADEEMGRGIHFFL